MKIEQLAFKAEIYRKLIHLSSLWIPISYLFFGKNLVLILLSFLTLIYVTLDILRVKQNKISAKIFGYFVYVLRKSELEKKKLTGASYMLVSSILVIYFFEKHIAIASLLVLVISDSIAALIGKKIGKIRIFSKTLEGAFAFFISGLIVFLWVRYYLSIEELNLFTMIVVIFVTTLVELFSGRFDIDDNFSIPICFSLTAKLFEII